MTWNSCFKFTGFCVINSTAM